MIKKSFFVACLSFVAVASFSQVKIKDVRTNPDLYFLRADEVASSLNLLPDRLAVYLFEVCPIYIGPHHS